MAQTATWTGGNTFKGYGGAANWNPVGVPIGPGYTIIIPDSSSLVYDLGSNGVVDAVSLGAGSVIRITNGFGYAVNGPAQIKGQIEAGRPGSAFQAPANVTVLQYNPRLYASEGGQILVGASTYTWDRYNAGMTLLSSVGTNSLLDLKSVSSLSVSYGDGGAWVYGINARSNGIIDLSGATQITGPEQDDWLDYNVGTGGAIKLDLLRRISGRMRFNLAVPQMDFPQLENASTAYFTLGSNSSVNLPALLSYSAANISLAQGAAFRATNLNSVSSATLNVGAGAVFSAPRLLSMDTVPLNLTNDGVFAATNLLVYRNSDIPIIPGRNFQSGLLTNVDGSQVRVSGGSTFRLGAPAYNSPGDWRLDANILTADGAGSVLGATNMTSVQVEGGYGGAWTYAVTADHNGVVDLRELETAAGADPGYGNDDWLAFNVRNGGTLRLDSLRQVTRKTQFNIGLGSPPFHLPALESAEYSEFNLPDGAELNVTNLTRLYRSAINFGFNSRFNAPRLTTLTDMSLDLGVGKLLTAPPFTNIYASRLSVSAGSVLHVGALAYDVPLDWRWSPTLFSADGAGSLLDMASMKSLRVHGGHNASWVYSVNVNNSGVIDLSGLETVVGCDPGNWSGDDWLDFNVRNGGSLLLTSLRQVTRRTRFNIEVPDYTFPSLQQVDTTIFTLANGTRLNMPSLTQLSDVTFNYGVGSTLNAPNLLTIANADFAVGPGHAVILPPLTNVNAARLSVTGGSNLLVAATAYETLPDWRTSATLFLSDGTGSLLDLSAMRTIRAYGGAGGQWNYSIIARNNGLIDLSALETAQGETPGDYGDDDWLIFNVQNGGIIRLDSLRQAFGHVQFSIGDNGRLSAPSLRSIANSTIGFGFNSTMDASNLLEFVDSSVSLSPGKNLYVPGFTNIFASRFAVSGGSSFAVGATNYDMYNDWRWSPVLFSADGTGSYLDLSSIKTFRGTGGHNAGWNYQVTANNGSVINLTGLDTVIGCDPGNWGGEDWLSFNAMGAGVVRFGNASVTRRALFTASAGDSRLEFASLYLRAPASVNISSGAILNIKGNYLFENTDPNSIQVAAASVVMDGPQPQTLEVGGKNLGPTGASSLNFGYSRLAVGNSNQASIVRLQDGINNGQRGAGGESEALYLYGLDGQGLRLWNNSKLILNGVPVYAMLGGQMRLLNNMVSPGTNSIAFDGGFLANSAGPRIISMVPSNAVTPPISSVDVTFDIPIQNASFTLADVTISGPGGAIGATAIAPVSGNTYRISFPSQGVTGTYTVRIGPVIHEIAGNFSGMDQDADGLSGEAGQDVFVGNFGVDGLPPVLLSAYALQNGTRVGVSFDEQVAAAFATNAANYSVNGLTPSKAVLQPNGYQVALWVSPLVGETFSLAANNAVDLLGNTANRAITGTILPMEARDIGSPGSNPREAGSTLTFDGVDFETVAGGSDFYWNGSDAGHFAFEARPGDFDVRVQVTRIIRAETYSQAGIMWRESAAGNARRVYACLNDPAANNTYWALIRYNPGEAGAQFPGSPQPAIGSLPAWVRLQRAGNVFIAYRGTDGTNWTEYGRVTTDFPAGGFAGLATSARNNTAGAVATANYRNYGDISPAIVSQPQGQTVASGSTVVFGVTGRGLPTLAYQWLFNGLPLNNATSPLLTIPNVTTNNVGDYRVVITNNYGSVTSQVAALVVDGIGGGGFEGDVMPAPYGNNLVSVSDWTRVGRLVAGLDSVLSSSEFMRADCAPRTNAVLGTLPLGDARLTVADWAQAGRYAAGLNPLTPAGGPNQPGFGPMQALRLGATTTSSSESRLLRVLDAKAAIGQTFSVGVELASQGNENAVGFSITFDSEKIAYVGAVASSGALGASVQVNALQAAQGRLGIALAMPAGQSLPTGSIQIAQVRFQAVGPAGSTELSLDDTPVVREIASVTAEAQPAEYGSGLASLIEPGRLTLPVQSSDGRVALNFTGQPGESYRVEVSTDLSSWELLSLQTAGSAAVSIQDPDAGQFSQRFYRAVLQP